MGKIYNESQKNASLSYAKNNLKRVPLDLRKDHYEILKNAASSLGMSVNGFIKCAIDEKIASLND